LSLETTKQRQLAAPTAARAFTAAHGVLEGAWVDAPYLEVDAAGTIVRAQTGLPSATDLDRAPIPVHDLGRAILLPGLINAHSHAFQRSIRGATHRAAAGDPSTFWSWRQAMYRAAQRPDPDGLYAVTRACFSEMLRAGITCVGEFHYLHHRPDGGLYDDPNELSNQIIRAADDVGLRLVLLEVFYQRAGDRRPPLPEQRRFCDPSLDVYLARVDALRARGVDVGVAPHSVRAVARPQLEQLADYAARAGLVMHAHVSEQPLENHECAAEHGGLTPTQVFAASGCLDRPRSFSAVHAIHVDAADLALLATQHVCACPTTEADLGDGIVPAADHLTRGARIALGSDSNAIIDLFQEARLLEMNERLRSGRRLCLSAADRPLGLTLLDAATVAGASALGRPDLGELAVGAPFDAITLDRDHPTLADVASEHLLDAIMLAGSAAPVDRVYVAGHRRR
jgi:formimidoylglutamate deiminase